jgi:hypothetical protein
MEATDQRAAAQQAHVTPAPELRSQGDGRSFVATPVRGTPTGERLLSEMREEIGRADTKASILIGAVGMCSGLLAARAAAPTGVVSGILWWCGAGAWVVAICFLLLAATPRYRRSTWKQDEPLSYFLDIRRAARAGHLAEAVRSTETEPLAALTVALANTSDIVTAKHRCIRAGLAFFACGCLLLATSLIPG